MPQKYEREIDEILRQMDTFLPEEPRHRRLGKRLRALLAVHQPWGLVRPSPGQLMAAGLALVLLSYLLRAVAPALAAPTGLVALVCFVGALALSVIRSRRRPVVGWRGRMLDHPPSEGLLWRDWLRRWRAWRQGRRQRY